TDATNFRNGNVNMHYLHINGEKGRSCNTCHDVHGTKGKFLISDKVLFGNWEMDMNYVVKEFGGSCATGCHAEEEYNRNFEQLLVTENSLTNESTKVVPNKRYQDYSEHVQSIDVSVIEFNERAEKQMIEKNDSMDQILPTQNDVVLTEDEYTMQVLSQLAVDTVIDLAPNQQESDKILEENILIDTITNKDIALNEPVKKEVSKEIKPNELLNKDTDTEQKIETIDEGVDAIDFPIKNFAFSTSEIDSEGEKLIIPLVEYLKKNLSVNIELHGHTDSIGSADYNQYLSILRANKVKEFLVKNGIEGTRIKVRGFGESKPLTPNSNSKERAQNRRVEFVILNNEN
nr:OmpA family protein [Bacteroidales bacterium]